MINWMIGKEHPLKGGGKFFPLAVHDGVYFGRQLLPGAEAWEACSFPEATEDVLDIPVPTVVWYMNVVVDEYANVPIILAAHTSKQSANSEKRRYGGQQQQRAGYHFLKQVVVSSGEDVQDPNTWNAAVNAAINLLKMNNDLTEDREELLQSLLRE